MKIDFEVLGDPMGKQRPKVATYGKFAHAYTPKETVNYESKVVNAFKEEIKSRDLYVDEHPLFPNECEVYATIVAYFQIQKTHYGKKGLNKSGQDKLNGVINPTKAPDCDNIAKICLDALNGIAYHDDSQITALLVMKKYSETPKVVVSLESRPLC